MTEGTGHTRRESIAGEVDETALHICAGEFHTNMIAHVETLEPAFQSALDRRQQEPDPGAFFRRAGDDRIKTLANPVG